MKKVIKFNTQALFFIWLGLVVIFFAMSRDGAIGELVREPNYDKADGFLIMGVVVSVPVVLYAMYGIILVWIIKPIKWVITQLKYKRRWH